eukprot:5781299-Amphidinium_carterae.1
MTIQLNYSCTCRGSCGVFPLLKQVSFLGALTPTQRFCTCALKDLHCAGVRHCNKTETTIPFVQIQLPN